MAAKERNRTCREALIEDARYTLGDQPGEEKSQSIDRTNDHFVICMST